MQQRKNAYLTILLSLIISIAFGQDTTYYDQNNNVTDSTGNYHHYKVSYRDVNDTNKIHERVFYNLEQIKKSIDLVRPEFPGGTSALIQFMERNLNYPEKSKQNRIEGKVLVKFIVEKDGSLTNINVVESLNKEMDDEAVLLIKKMPKWKPGEQGGNKVRVECNLPINFNLR